MQTHPTPVLQNRTLLRLGLAEAISQIGDWITMMAIFALLVFKGGGNVTESSGIYLAGLLPSLPASLLAGWLCDRFDRKLLLIASQLLAGLTVTGLIFTDQLGWIYLLLGLESVFLAIVPPARQASIPQIVPAEQLSQANALLQQLQSIVKIGAPMLAGALLAVMPPHQAIILDVVSFGVSTLLLLTIPTLPPRGKNKLTSPSSTENTSLLRVLKASSGLQQLFLSMFFAIFIIMGFDVLSSVYIRDILHGDEQFYGIVISMIGLGTLLATIWLISRDSKSAPWRDLVLGLGLLTGIPLSLFIAGKIGSPEISKVIVLAGCLTGGVGNGMANIQVSTLLQTLTPAEILGRMSGLYQTIVTAGQLIGLVVTPLLVPGLLSISNYFLATFLGLVALVALLALQLNRFQNPVPGETTNS